LLEDSTKSPELSEYYINRKHLSKALKKRMRNSGNSKPLKLRSMNILLTFEIKKFVKLALKSWLKISQQDLGLLLTLLYSQKPLVHRLSTFSLGLLVIIKNGLNRALKLAFFWRSFLFFCDGKQIIWL
jgi:hypothetical protein